MTQGIRALQATGPQPIKANPRQIPTGVNNRLISNVSFEFAQVNSKTTFVQFTDANNSRFSVPEEAIPKPSIDQKGNLKDTGFRLLDESFGFEFVDPLTNKSIVTTEGQSMILMDKYLQIDMLLPSRRLYGFGERKGTFTLKEGTWTMWATSPGDGPAEFDDGTGGKQTYSVHPFLLA